MIAELVMYIGLAGMMIGIVMIFGPMFKQASRILVEHPHRSIAIGFIIYSISVFIVIAGAFVSSELGKSIIKLLSELV